MKKQSPYLTFCALPFAIAGCAALSNKSLSGSSRDLAVYAKFPQKVQTVVTNTTVASIATLSIVPYIETSSGSYSPLSSVTGNATSLSDPNVLMLSQASPSIDPNRPFIVRRMKPNSKYRILGRAYGANNALISSDSASFVDVPITNNDAPPMVNLPVQLVDTPFGATVTVNVEAATGWFDYLKTTLYLVSGGTQLQISQTTRQHAPLALSNLQANTTYRLVAEAYQGGSLIASNSVNIVIGNDDTPVSVFLPLDLANKGIVTTFAGVYNASGYADGNGTTARFSMPHALTVWSDGNIYVADVNNQCIRKVTPQGDVSTFVGATASGLVDGTGTNARFYQPTDIKYDLISGNFFVVDAANHAVRKVTPQGVVSTFAGGAGSGYQDGQGTQARFNNPVNLCIDSQGNLYVTEKYNNAIRKITPSGLVTTFAGNGTGGHADGVGTLAQFSCPFGITCDRQNNLYVADYAALCVRKITPQALVSTLAGTYGASGCVDGTGTAARFKGPHGIAIDTYGNLYITDYASRAVRKLNPQGVVTTLAGNGTAGFQDGTGTAAQIAGDRYPTIDNNGVLYITDENSIRRIQ